MISVSYDGVRNELSRDLWREPSHNFIQILHMIKWFDF